MNALPEKLFANPVWHALHSKHRKFAKCAGDACRYAPDVVPFAAINAPGVEPMLQLHSLFEPGESAWIIGRNTRRFRDSFARKLWNAFRWRCRTAFVRRIRRLKSSSCRTQTRTKWWRSRRGRFPVSFDKGRAKWVRIMAFDLRPVN